jgi:putative flavoprotein involved in K+ transport
VIVIGAGQAGLSVGYHLARQGRSFVILDANARVGDSWRQRWDSLRLFTPARYDSIIGLPFPAPPHSFPTKDQMADYLESYAAHYELPVLSGVRVDRLTREGDRYVVTAGTRRFEADHVVVAMASYQAPRVPAFARDLSSSITQIHSSEYRNPSQLREGGVLIVGAGNSGAEIGIELARSREVFMSGRDTGHVPFRVESSAARLLLPALFRVVFHRILTVNTPMGRKARVKMLTQGGPLIRVKPKDMAAAGVVRVPRVAGVERGLPCLADGRVLDVANVIWCTGFSPGFSWIDLPVFEADGGEPKHQSGIVPGEPGLYFVGLHFLHAFSSTMIHGVARDAARIADAIAARTLSARRSERDAENSVA